MKGLRLNLSLTGGGLGPELVTNGTFDSNTTGWTASNATLSSESGRLRVTRVGTTVSLGHQQHTLSPGERYLLTFDQFTGTTTAAMRVGNSVNGADYVLDSTAGTGRTATFVPTQATVYINCRASGTTDGQYAEFDNISLKRLR